MLSAKQNKFLHANFATRCVSFHCLFKRFTMHHYTKAEVKVLIVSKSSSKQFRSLFFSLSMKFSATNLIFTWKLFRQEYFCVIRICGRKFVLLVHGKACDEHFEKFIKYSHHTNIEAVVLVGGRFSSTERHQVVVAQCSVENERWRWMAQAAFLRFMKWNEQLIINCFADHWKCVERFEMVS